MSSVLLKSRVLELRRRGHSYGEISSETGLSRNTVKSWCQREGITPQVGEVPLTQCVQCQVVLERPRWGRRFCSGECRLAWWHANPDRLNRKAIYTHTCHACGTGFEAYGNKSRKYCSHACYITDRFHAKRVGGGAGCGEV